MDSLTEAVLLASYDEQLRRRLDPPQPGWRVERVGAVIRMTAPDDAPPDATGGVLWSDLDDDTADAVIAQQVAHFAALGRAFEWKHHGYDRPADLPDRLVRAGFVAEETESLLAGTVEDVARAVGPPVVPVGVRLRHLRDDSDYPPIAALHATIWGGEWGWLAEGLAAEKAHDPDSIEIHLAEAVDGDGEAQLVCAAWVRFAGDTEFASLWGGGTHPAWRRRGIYRALVSRRTAEAAARGARYLQVDASDDSRPILERLGLRRLTSTTPYVWRPSERGTPEAMRQEPG